MTWFVVDDGFCFHAKTVAAGAALSLWVRAGSWSSQQLTDGFIPDHMVPVLGNTRWAETLVRVGLWTKQDQGFSFNDWCDYQLTREQVFQRREAKQEAGRKGGQAKARNNPHPASPKSETAGQARNGSSKAPSKDLAPATAPAKQQPSSSQSSGTAAVVANGYPSPSPTPNPPSPNGEGGRAPSTEVATTNGSSDNAAPLIAEWIDHCNERPPTRLIGQVGKEVRALIADGIATRHIRAGLQAWHTNGKSLPPTTLPSFVNEAMNRPANGGRRSTTDERVAAGLALAAKYAAEDGDTPTTRKALP